MSIFNSIFGTVFSPTRKIWTPAEITTLAWYDPSDLSTIVADGSNNVVSIADKSGNGFTMTPPVGFEPVTGVNSRNALNVLTMDGGARVRNNNGFSFPASGNLSVIAVHNVTAVDHDNDGIWGFNSDALDVDFIANSFTQFDGKINFNATNTSTPFTTLPILDYFMSSIVLDFANTNTFGYVNGLLDADGTGNYTAKITDGATTRSLTIFGNDNGAQMPYGYMAEYVFLEDVTTATRQKIEGYLAWKWGTVAGLPVGHPYKTEPPYVG